MGPEGMKRRLYTLIENLEAQEATAKKLARVMGVAHEELQRKDGTYVMTPILLAQAQALSTLQSLQASEKRKWRNSGTARAGTLKNLHTCSICGQQGQWITWVSNQNAWRCMKHVQVWDTKQGESNGEDR